MAVEGGLVRLKRDKAIQEVGLNAPETMRGVDFDLEVTSGHEASQQSGLIILTSNVRLWVENGL
ncbi:hypothetical protein BIY45_15285 [Stenotrophomonas sp. BIIR7]|nr:hypothetical protein BIY45_15285 [Stenotrophomonas sp. BIIR7]